MGRKNTENSSAQYQLPFMATEHPLVARGLDSAVITNLQQNPHWNAITGSHAAIVDLDHSYGAIVAPGTIAVDRLSFGVDLSTEHRLGGIAIIFPSVRMDESDRQFFAGYTHPLSQGGVLLVFERYTDSLPNAIPRKRILHDAGYVHIGFSHTSDYMIWHAQKHKDAHRRPVNIWESERSGYTAQQYLSFMREAYGASGFILLSDSVIIERVSASTYVPQDLRYLLEGRGVKVLSPCGCELEKTFSEVDPWQIISEVPECGHPGMQDSIVLFDHMVALRMPYQETSNTDVVPVITSPPPNDLLLTVSKDEHWCGEIQYVSRAIKPIHRNDHQYMRYQIDKNCPHCGDIFRDKTRIVDVLLA